VAKILARNAALQAALHEVGVRERGANNQGARVNDYQRADSLPGVGYAWCNSFIDFCYEVVGRPLTELGNSASVDYTLHAALNHGWVEESPHDADLVVFNFSHIGFVKHPVNKATLETVEGNTGASGAVSDSKGGGDGVYHKLRPSFLAKAFIKVPGEIDDKKLKAFLATEDGMGHTPIVRPTSDEGFWQWLRWDQGRSEFKRFGKHNLAVRPKNLPDRIPLSWRAARAKWLAHQPK
jgi:hypothetical protein